MNERRFGSKGFSSGCGPLASAALLVCVMGTAVAAQDWRGMGRVGGKVTDEAGAPLEGVVVKAVMAGASAGLEVKSSRGGDWAIGGLARGEWNLDFEKPGFETRRITVSVNETGRTPPVELKLKKAAPTVDANAEIRDRLVEAAGLLNQKKFAEARAIYEGLLAKYPEAHQIHPLIARTYYGESQFDKSIEHLRLALAKDPDNAEVKLLLGNVLVERGQAAEGKQILESVDESLVKDPTTFLNVGIVFINQNKPAEALIYFDKTVNRFPEYPDAYYYRGITYLQTGKNDEARTDLQKFVTMAPDAPEAATARKILEQLKN